MSRIAGIVSNTFQVDHKKYLLENKALPHLKPLVNYTYDIKTVLHTSMLWLGSGNSKLVEKENILVAIDGFIYNINDFKTNETNHASLIIELYRKYGLVEMLKLLNGDFTISIYDRNANVFYLIRDRIGVRPAYYVHKHNYLAFASKPGALLEMPEVTRSVNKKFVATFAASHYRYFDNAPTESPFEDIKQLPAAHYLQFDLSNNKIQLYKYWNLTDQGDFSENEDVLAQQYQELLLDAVKIRFNSTPKPAFTLSGGMDSSSVLASSVHVSGKKQFAFSSVYSDKTFDETEEIKTTADAHVQEWSPVKIEVTDVFEAINQMVALHDEPVATATWLSHFILCKQVAEKGYTALFGGLGGDELNAGEYEYFFCHFADLKKQGKETILKHEIEYWSKYHDHPIYKKNEAVVYDTFKQAFDFSTNKCLPDKRRMLRYSNVLNKEFFDLNQLNPTLEHPFSSFLKNRTYQDLTRETIPCCLRAEDRQTDAFGLDNMVPFFDYRLVEFMYRIQGNMKIRDGVTKYLLRKAMKGILCEPTRTRIAKTGWNAPAHLWFSGKGKEQLLDRIHSQTFKNYGIYNINELDKIIEEHDLITSQKLQKENHMMFLWQLANLSTWLDTYIKKN